MQLNRKKGLALLLSLIMIISLFSGMTLAGAAEEGASDKAYYVKADSMVPGAEVLLVTATGDRYYALSYDGSSFGAAELIMDGTYATMEAGAAKTATWLYDDESYLSIGSTYLYPSSSRGLMTYTSGRAISYADGNISWSTSAGADYLTFDGSSFGTVRVNGGTAAGIQIYVKLGFAKQVSAFTEGKEYAIVAKSGDDCYAFGATAANTFIAKKMDVSDGGDLIYSVDDDTVFWRYEDGSIKNVGLEKAGDSKPYL